MTCSIEYRFTLLNWQQFYFLLLFSMQNCPLKMRQIFRVRLEKNVQFTCVMKSCSSWTSAGKKSHALKSRVGVSESWYSANDCGWCVVSRHYQKSSRVFFASPADERVLTIYGDESSVKSFTKSCKMNSVYPSCFSYASFVIPLLPRQ